ATTALSPLSLHDALPISRRRSASQRPAAPSGLGLNIARAPLAASHPRRSRMPITRAQATQLLNQGETALYDDSRINGLRQLDARSEEHTSELQSRENIVC